MWKWLCNIPADKALHLIAGMLVVAVVATIFPCMAEWSVVVAIVAGVGKEIRDEVVYGGFDWEDLATTIVGGFIMQIFIWLNV